MTLGSCKTIVSSPTASLGALLLGIALLAGCSSPDPTVDESIVSVETPRSRAYHNGANVPSHGVALEGYCPVAYFAVDKAVRGRPEYAEDYGGVTYYFVSAEAREEFRAHPTKYLPAYGGWCAFGMAVEDKFPVDPTNFKIVDGQLMLFLKNKDVDALELWNKGDASSLKRKADTYWKKVRN